jgi:hypothetical protein
MTSQDVESILGQFKISGGHYSSTVVSKEDTADIVAALVNKSFANPDRNPAITILVESEREKYTKMLSDRLPGMYSYASRGLLITSPDVYLSQLTPRKANTTVIIRDGFGVLRAHELSLTYTNYDLVLTVVNTFGKRDDATPPVKEGTSEDTSFGIINSLQALVDVHETRYGVNLTAEDRSDYDTYSDYIKQTYNIFGGNYQMQAAYKGDYKRHLTAEQICTDIANSNGWDARMDMTSPVNRQIDEMYSPVALKERVNVTYKFSASRKKLCSDNGMKLATIFNIVRDNLDKRILILSCRGEFADVIVTMLNTEFGKLVAMPFHDEIPTTIKGTTKAGKPKPYGHVKASRDAVAALNDRKIVALSGKGGSIYKDIPFQVDLVIITSPLACSFADIAKRCTESLFGDEDGLKLIKIYFNDTIEENVVLRHNDAPDYDVIGGVKRETVSNNDDTFID